MDFSFVVGRHSLKSGKEKVMGGFLDLETAQDYVIIKEGDFLSNIYFYIDSPEGRHIYGADYRTEKGKWYLPNQKTFVYDASLDQVVSLEECI